MNKDQVQTQKMALVQQEIMVSTFIDFTGGIHLQGNGTANATPNSTGIAFGSGIVSVGANSISLGNTSTASGSSCISLGTGASTSGTQATSIGINTSTAADNDISFGSNAQCVGSGGSGSRIACGVNVVCGSASQSFCISIGAGSTATMTGSMALGRLASATFANSTALGINATTTTTNQTVIGGSSNTQVLCNVGTGGLLESTGYVVSFIQVRAGIQPTTTQTINSGLSATAIAFGTITYASDYGTPSIASVASQLQIRANRTMVGMLSLHFVFSGGNPLANATLTVRIVKSTNGVVTTVTQQTVSILTTSSTYIVSVPFIDFNATVPSPSVFYAADMDNPAAIGRALVIQTASHFNGNFIN